MAVTRSGEQGLPIQVAFHVPKYTTFEGMARIFASTLASILLFFRWKQTTVFANLNATRSWSGWQENPPSPRPFYRQLISQLSREALRFLFGFRHTSVSIHPDSLDAVEQMKSGGLMLTAHLGNWELLGSSLRSIGIPLVATFQPFPHSLSNRILAWVRARNGNRVERFEDSPFAIRSLFRKGNLFAFLADQDYRQFSKEQSPTPGRFLGLPAHGNPLPQRVLELFPELPLFFAVAKPISPHSYQISVVQVAHHDSSASILFLYNAWLESEIAQTPQMWAGWTHKRFLSTLPTLYSHK